MTMVGIQVTLFEQSEESVNVTQQALYLPQMTKPNTDTIASNFQAAVTILGNLEEATSSADNVRSCLLALDVGCWIVTHELKTGGCDDGQDSFLACDCKVHPSCFTPPPYCQTTFVFCTLKAHGVQTCP